MQEGICAGTQYSFMSYKESTHTYTDKSFPIRKTSSRVRHNLSCEKKNNKKQNVIHEDMHIY